MVLANKLNLHDFRFFFMIFGRFRAIYFFARHNVWARLRTSPDLTPRAPYNWPAGCNQCWGLPGMMIW
jgi:hypothetical protein